MQDCRGRAGAVRRGGSGIAGLLADALDRLGLSARSYHRILRIARTIADMEGDHGLNRQHMLQAIQLRRSGLACDFVKYIFV
jgi:predicted ATPase with chaperone activity